MTREFGKLRAFKSEAAAERAGQWALAALCGSEKAIRWCDKHSVAVTKDAREGVAIDGGFLVPAELGDAVIDRREVYGIFRATAQRAPMASAEATWPATRTGVTAQWAGEGQTLTASQAGLANIGLYARKLAALVYSSNELNEDAAVIIGDWLADEMGAAFAAKEDAAAFLGDGTSTYAGFTGLVPGILGKAGASKVTAASGHDTFAEIDGTDLATLMAALPAAAFPGAAWFISATGFASVFCRLASASGGIIGMPGPDGRVRPYFLGFPVYFVQSLPGGSMSTDLSGQVIMLFGDMRRAAMIGEVGEFSMSSSSSGPATFATDQIAFKGISRVAFNVHDLGDATTAGSIVALVGE